jgi:cyclic dehypoxanthinyl futalosine synthase
MTSDLLQCEPPDMSEVAAGRARLTATQALWLYHHASIHELSEWATAAADRVHGDKIRTYLIDRNINYTNICSARCTFCAFRRDRDAEDAYVISEDELYRKIGELSDIGGTQILLQGGMHPDLPLEYYEQMLNGIREQFPHIHIHAFSPPEFVEFVAVCRIDDHPITEPRKSHELPRDTWLAKLEAIMRRLMAAGLASIPGGGAEILPMHVRRRIGSTKATASQWLDVMRTAHRLGMFTSATMMFGHIEGIADRIAHMQMIRDAQDEAWRANWPGRYMAFIAWPFQPDHTALGRVPRHEVDAADVGPFPGDVLGEAVLAGRVDGGDAGACRAAVPQAGRSLRLAGALDYLRTQAIARLFLDNVHSIGSSWVTMGPEIGQVALKYGSNDMGSVMMEENVVSAAGTTYRLDEAKICHLIRNSGYTPAQRDNVYRFVKVHAGDDSASPDLAVTDWSTQRAAPPSDSASCEPTVGKLD